MKKKLLSILAVMLMTLTANAQNTFVDLGLPSGTLWATCNVGADSPEGDGYYFAWGETERKETYTWSNYKYSYSGDNMSFTKYCTDSSYGHSGFMDDLTELLPEDDAATANWGADWQMPSKAQLEELFNSDNTTVESETLNGQTGMRITSKSNGNSIFLPSSGYNREGVYYGDGCYYWSRSLYDLHPAKAFCYYGKVHLVDELDRSCGLKVRPVRVQEEHTIYNIPSGWIVNGTTTSGTYQAKGGDAVHFTPKNIPSGKKIKSIKVVKK